MNRYKKYGTVVQTENFGPIQLGLPFGMDLYYTGGDWEHKVQFEERSRPDLLAWPYFDSPYPWEQILDYNGIDDPIGQIKPGMSLMIPVDGVKEMEAFSYYGTDEP